MILQLPALCFRKDLCYCNFRLCVSDLALLCFVLLTAWPAEVKKPSSKFFFFIIIFYFSIGATIFALLLYIT